MLERYYNINDAADFLSKETGEKISASGTLDLAARGMLRLCIWFNGNAELSCYYPHLIPTFEQIFLKKWLKGYIQIPKESIAPHHREFRIHYAIIIEAYDSGNNEGNWLGQGETMIAARPIKSFNEETHEVEFDAIAVNTENALIPAKDLIDFVSQMKEYKVKPLSTTERNTLLTIIGLMAKDGYGDDLSHPYSLAKCIVQAGEILGVAISAQSVADKFIDAKKVLQEKAK